MSNINIFAVRNKVFQRHSFNPNNEEFGIKRRKCKRDCTISAKRLFSTIFSFMLDSNLSIRKKLSNLDLLISQDKKIIFPAIVEEILIISISETEEIFCGCLKKFLDFAFEELFDFSCPIKHKILECIYRMSLENSTTAFKEKHLLALVKLLLKNQRYKTDYEILVIIIGNLAADVEQRDYFIQQNIWKVIFKVIENEAIKESELLSSLWTLTNLLRGNPPPPLCYIKGFLAKVNYFLLFNSNPITKEILWGISYILEHKVLAKFVIEFMEFSLFCNSFLSEDLKEPSIRCIGFFLYHDLNYSKYIISSNMLGFFFDEFDNLESSIVSDVFLVLKLLCETNEDYAMIIASHPKVNKVIVPCISRVEDNQQEGLNFVKDLLSHLDYYKLVDFSHKVPEFFSITLEILSSSSALNIVTCLEIIFMILEKEEEFVMVHSGNRNIYSFFEDKGLEIIDNLQNHTNDEVYFKSKELIMRFFECEVFF